MCQLSASWDLMICAWDWSGKLLKCLDVTPAECEDVKDTIITDLDWSQERYIRMYNHIYVHMYI